MYQDTKKKWIYLGVYILCFLPCAFLFLIGLLDFILVAAGQIKEEKSFLLVAAVVFTLFAILSIVLWFKILKMIWVGKMNRYFEMDEDGLIAISDLSGYMHMKQKKCVSVFLDCIGKGLLKNCMIFPKDPTYILLDNGKNTIAEKYIVIHCNSCAAPNTLRIGFEHQCKYCGAEIQGM